MSDLPNVDFPTIHGQATLPGASPETMASAVATPLEKQFSTIAGIDPMTSTSSLGFSQHHPSIHARPQHRCRGAGRAGGHQPGAEQFAAEHADSAHLPEGESGRIADPLSGAALATCRCPTWTNTPRRSWRSASRWSTAWRRCRSSAPHKYAVRVQVDPDKLATRQIGINEVDSRPAQPERQHAHRHALRPAHGLHRPGQRPADTAPGLHAADRRLPQRRSGAARATLAT